MNDSSHSPDPDDEATLHAEESARPREESDEDNIPEISESSSGFKAGPFAIIAVLICIFMLVQVQRKLHNRDLREEADQQQAIADGNVPLTIIATDTQPEISVNIPWRPGMTVRDLMIEAQKMGKLTFAETGEGADAMLTSIQDTKNEGGGPSSYNWIYRVDGKVADKSFAVYELKKGNIVSWQFGAYE